MAQIQINADFGTYMRDGAPTQNHPGDGAYFVAGRATETQRGIIKIPFTGLPAGSIITAVTLDVYLNDKSLASNNRLMRFYRCKRVMTYAGASWNNWDTGQAWQTAGAAGANDREGTDSGSRTMNTTDTINQYYSVTMTVADIQAMFDGGYTNNGFIVKMDTETADAYIFDGHAGSNPPRFTIDYTPPPSSGSSAFFMNLLS